MDPVEVQQQLNANYYFNCVSFTLIFYDYFLTLEWEVSRYWGPSFTFRWPTMVFFANRYATILGNIPAAIEYFWATPSSPAKFTTYHKYFVIIIQVFITALLTVRTYALYEHSKRILALIMGFIVVTAGLGLWATFRLNIDQASTTYHAEPYFGCTNTTTRTQALNFAAPWTSLFFLDCVIFVLTVRKAFHGFRDRHSTGSELFTVLLRDGSVYFAVMALAHLSNIMTFFFGTDYTRGIATTFTSNIGSLMISRLMLNLRDPDLSDLNQTGHTRNPEETELTAAIQFASVAPGSQSSEGAG
ncbi:unnamed protein product [Mycena citricolor]|uniref:DUF6533 domain-containing protein n=1 Tax=Mycena citricolor TaxID=2018698 RepID=A0AAD2Q3L1_9AGAR|nr:unnamed protein product [Mycena citricolor]